MMGLIILFFLILPIMLFIFAEVASNETQFKKPTPQDSQPINQDAGFAPLASTVLARRERNQLLMDWWEQDFEIAVEALQARQDCFEIKKRLDWLRYQQSVTHVPYARTALDKEIDKLQPLAANALMEWQTKMHRTDTPKEYKYAKVGYAPVDRKTDRALQSWRP